MADAILAQGGVYIIRNLVNLRIYVGSTVQFSNRWRTHKRQLRLGIHNNKKLQRSWAKHGESEFRFEVLEAVGEQSGIIPREQFWLDHLKPFGATGYNIRVTADSNAGIKFGDEHKRRIGDANRGKKRTAEVRAAISVANRSRPPHSEGHKQKISKTNTGRQMSTATREKISVAKMGKLASEETRQKMSIAKTGKFTSKQRAANIAGVAKRIYSPELRLKFSEAGRKGGSFARSDEQRAQMSVIKKGKKMTPETIAKMVAARKATIARKLAERGNSASK